MQAQAPVSCVELGDTVAQLLTKMHNLNQMQSSLSARLQEDSLPSESKPRLVSMQMMLFQEQDTVASDLCGLVGGRDEVGAPAQVDSLVDWVFQRWMKRGRRAGAA